MRGLPRFFDDPDVPDTGVGNVPPGVVDMGAYERIPITVTDPAGQTICAGGPAIFSVTATGQPTLTYRWSKNSAPLSNGGSISGATTDTLTISPTVAGDTGNYDVVVTDGFGQSLTSVSAALTVNARPDGGRLRHRDRLRGHLDAADRIGRRVLLLDADGRA